MVVDEHLWVPPGYGPEHRAGWCLGKSDQIAVHVEPEMTEPTPDRPRLSSLERKRLVSANRERVVPDSKSFVPIGVCRWVEHDQHAVEDLTSGRFVGSDQLVSNPHGRFETGRLVPVNRVGQKNDHRAPCRYVSSRIPRGATGIGETRQVGADLVEAGQVLGGGDQEHPHRAVFFGDADRFRLNTVSAGCDQPVEYPLLFGVLGVALAGLVPEYVVGSGHSWTVGTT